LSRYENRRLEICFASEAELQRWKDRASLDKAPLARWVRATIENYLAEEERGPRHQIEEDSFKLREENRNLKRELQKTEAALQLAESQLIHIKHGKFLEEEGSGPQISKELIELLRPGCLYPGREILKELHIAPNDGDSIKILHKQLEILVSVGLVKEEPKGWRWIE
jgi:hypothetical protein